MGAMSRATHSIQLGRCGPAARATALAIAVVLGVAACGGDAATPGRDGASSPAPSAAPAKTAKPKPTPKVTPVPDAPETPGPSLPPTTSTVWGTILDGVPPDFPVYPGATVTDPIEGPASGAWATTARVGKVAPWYQAALEAAGFATVNLSAPLEDGTMILDMEGDSPDCQLQASFRPLDGSTIISVLYGAGCPVG